MIVRTCLLISDDPDDHTELSEALYEISDDTVLITVAGLTKALDLLALKKCIPEFIFLNVGMSDFEPETFFRRLDDPALKHVQVIACGESPDLENLTHARVTAFLHTDVSYSELKSFLQRVLKGG
jgi:DNA-binding NarL/FixJ family response regulator